MFSKSRITTFLFNRTCLGKPCWKRKGAANSRYKLGKPRGKPGRKPGSPKNTMRNADPVLTAKEVAEDLRCSKSQVYRLMSGDGGLTPLPHLPLGRKKVVPRSLLEKWKRQNISGIMRDDSETDTVEVMH